MLTGNRALRLGGSNRRLLPLRRASLSAFRILGRRKKKYEDKRTTAAAMSSGPLSMSDVMKAVGLAV